MADPNDTLKALLISLNVADESAVASYIAALPPSEAQRLLNVLMTGAGGRSQNLPGGEGGFLEGVRKLISARAALSQSDLPEDPKAITQSQKESAISAFVRDHEKSDDSFVAGLKILMEARSVESLEKFARWPGELSDRDFPRKVASFKSELEAKNANILAELQRTFDDQRIDTQALLKKHRTDSEKP